MRPFEPNRLFRNPHIQSIAASAKFRKPFVRRKALALLESSREIIVDCREGTKLQGFYSPHAQSGRGLVIFLHGWEGSSESIYLLSAAGHLYDRGYDVFRLNMRDHGDSHNLNVGLFHSCRLDEVHSAVLRIANDYSRNGKTFLAGFSLGGNFALRVSARAHQSGLALEKTVAVCPVLHPQNSMKALAEGSVVYRAYFIGKWKRSLLKKQALFPDIYDFSAPSIFRSLDTITEYLVSQHTEFKDVSAYMNGYSLVGDALKSLTIPTHIFLSRDDPVVPWKDHEKLAKTGSISITLTDFGGHCGFISGFSMESWINEAIAASFASTNHGAV